MNIDGDFGSRLHQNSHNHRQVPTYPQASKTLVSTYSSARSGPTSPQAVKSMQPRQEDNTRKISKGITAAVNISFTLDNDADDDGSYWESQKLKSCYTLTILRLSTEPL